MVFDGGPLQLSSHVLSLKDHPLKATHLGVRLLLAPPKGRDSIGSKLEVTPWHVLVPPEFPQENMDQRPNDFSPSNPSHVATPNLQVDGSTLRHKWWEKLIGDVRDDELVEGTSSKGKSKTKNKFIFSLINIQSVYEPQTYSDARGKPESKKAMES